MGFEHKILVALDELQKEAIQSLIESHPNYYAQYENYGNTLWEIKLAENNEEMPDVTLELDKDGLYICQHIGETENPWQHIETIAAYFSENNLSTEIYSEEEQYWEDEEEMDEEDEQN